MESEQKDTQREIMEESRTETIVKPAFKAVDYENQGYNDSYNYNQTQQYDYSQSQNYDNNQAAVTPQHC